MTEEKKEVKVEKKEKEEVEIGFDAGIGSIGGPLNVDNILDNIYTSIDN